MTLRNKVDVIIPCFNRLELIMSSILSVKSQTYPINKIIVVDDCSSFTNEQFWMELNNNISDSSNIEFHRKKSNGGACQSRNQGASLSEAEFIAFLDDDDMWEPEHIEKLINCFKDDKVALAYSGKKITNFAKDSVRKSLNVIPNKEQYKALLKCNYPGSTSSILVRKKYFLETSGFDEKLPAIQDYDFYLRLVKKGKIATSKAYTLIYRDDTGIKITNQLNKARYAFHMIIGKTEGCFKKQLAYTIFIQNIKKAVINKNIKYALLFSLDYFKFLLMSK